MIQRLHSYTVSQKNMPLYMHNLSVGYTLTDFQILFTLGFSEEFAIKPLSYFPTRPYVCCYTTLRNLKCHFCYFLTTAVTKTYIEIRLFVLVNVILII